MANSADVDAAIIARLSGDATLAMYAPDGVFFDIAAPGSSAFVIVSLLAHVEEPMLDGGTAWEVYTYLVKAVSIGTSGLTTNDAAQRIHELLQNAVLEPDGYSDMRCQRIERVRYQEVDEVNDARWNHRGGHYEVWVAPEDTVTFYPVTITPEESGVITNGQNSR